MRCAAILLVLLATPALAGNLPRLPPAKPAEVRAVTLTEAKAVNKLPEVKPVKLREHRPVEPRDVGKATAVPLDVDDDIHEGRQQVDAVKPPAGR